MTNIVDLKNIDKVTKRCVASGEKELPQIIATVEDHSEGLKYVLTRGFACKKYEDVKKLKDFAVYVGSTAENTSDVARHGNKVFAEKSAEIFGKMFDLQEEHFRR